MLIKVRPCFIYTVFRWGTHLLCVCRPKFLSVSLHPKSVCPLVPLNMSPLLNKHVGESSPPTSHVHDFLGGGPDSTIDLVRHRKIL